MAKKQMQANNLAKTIGILRIAPYALPAALASFGAVAMALLLLGELKSVYVWPLGIIASILTYIFVASSIKDVVPRGKVRDRWLVVVVVGILLWLGFNMFFTSQNMFVNRDPAIYMTAGGWLKDSDTLAIDAPSVFGEIEGIHRDSAAYPLDTNNSDHLSVQGLHLFPIFLGLIARVGGEGFMMHSSPFFGALALLSVYGVAVLFARPRWAALGTLGFALSYPLIYFSRDTYTEPLTAALIFGALALFWFAMRTGKKQLWFMAGLTSAASSMVRADGYFLAIVLLLACAVWVASGSKKELRNRVKQAACLATGILITGLLGWLDVTVLSSVYYRDVTDEIHTQFFLFGLSASAILLSVALYRYTRLIQYFRGFVQNNRKTIGFVCGVLVVLVILGLASRPLWQISRDATQPQVIQNYIGSLQVAEGQPLDKTRNYAENTATWIVWYMGPVLAILGAAGLVLAAVRVVKNPDIKLLPALILVLGTSIVFMVKVGITPDHVWASRRFLPITFPGLAIFAALALSQLAELKELATSWGKGLLAVIVLLLIGGPLVVTRPFLKTEIYVPQLSLVNKLCSSLPDNSAVLWVGPGGWNSIQTARSFCDKPAARTEGLTKADYSKAARNAIANGFEPIIVVEGADVEFTPDPTAKNLTSIGSAEYEVVPSNLYNPPSKTVVNSRSLFAGRVQDDGQIVPLGQQ